MLCVLLQAESGEVPAPQGWEFGVPRPCLVSVEPTRSEPTRSEPDVPTRGIDLQTGALLAEGLGQVGLGDNSQVALLVPNLPDGSEARLEAMEVKQPVRWWP